MMSTTTDYFAHAELALASYASLWFGMADTEFVNALESVEMAAPQAASFASTWIVVDQYTDPVTGLSATVFKDVSDPYGPGYLAIRGTDGLDDLIGADLDLAAGIPMESLRAQAPVAGLGRHCLTAP